MYKKIICVFFIFAMALPIFACNKEQTKFNIVKSYANVSACIETEVETIIVNAVYSGNEYCLMANVYSDVISCFVYRFSESGELLNRVEIPSNCDIEKQVAIINDVLVVPSIQGHLLFIDLNNGEVIRSVTFNNPVNGVCSSSDGYIVLHSNGLEKYSFDDELISRITCEEWGFAYGLTPYFETEDAAYITMTQGFEPEYYELDFQNNSAEYKLSLNGLVSVAPDCYGEFLVDNNYEYQIDVKNNALIPIYSWNYTDVKPPRKNVFQDEYYIFDSEHYLNVYRYSDYSIDLNFYYYDESLDLSNRIPVVIGGYDVNRDLAIKSAVYQFNTSQNEYRAVLEDYTQMFEYGSAFEAEQQTANLISYFESGHAPDIYYGSFFDYYYMGNSGSVLDLSSFLRESGIQNEMTASIGNLLSENECYSVFPGYHVCGYFALDETFANDSVSIYELSEYAEENDMMVIDRMSAVNIVDMLLRYSLRSRINTLNSDHVYSLEELEDAIEFGINNGVSSNDLNLHIVNAREVISQICPVFFNFISSVDDLGYFREFYNAEFSFIGYPNNNGSTHVIEPVGQVAVNSNSENIEQCYSIIEYMFSEDTQLMLGMNNIIPVNSNSFDLIVEMNSEVNEEDIKDFYEIIDTLDTVLETDWGIYNIIAEEVESYYLFGKSIDEIAVSLQNRLDLYVQENYG